VAKLNHTAHVLEAKEKEEKFNVSLSPSRAHTQ
jgi:hypothetical protein